MLQAALIYLEILRARTERGQGMVEYALILALVSIVAIVVLLLLGPAVADIFQRITTELEAV
jgi:pilus assembly protein Flp/PilA